jgi:hypothetical protein
VASAVLQRTPPALKAEALLVTNVTKLVLIHRFAFGSLVFFCSFFAAAVFCFSAENGGVTEQVLRLLQVIDDRNEATGVGVCRPIGVEQSPRNFSYRKQAESSR